MLNLMLLRHAKSSWADTGQADPDRPLNDRGKRSAVAVGRYMASNALVPQLVLCSPARRARETWGLVAGELTAIPQILVAAEIYDFGDGKALMKCLRHKAGAAQSVLLVGHNPSIAGLAQNLIGTGSHKLRERLEEKYPTAALAVISFDFDNWGSLATGSGTLLRFVRPGDIIDDD
ncbi:MAG: histidine phosphatase family protein [Rhizobiales bacterium]|nr:histidine phosphatase family protein [Hyphomicrobiales bacterium]